MKETPELWTATYEAETAEELAEAYKQWAGDYDKDTLGAMGYVGPHVAASILDNHLTSKSSRVLDAGCGTGLVGEYLQRMGYDNVDAMDFSKDMLNEAEKKGVYRNLFQEDMNRDLAIPDDSYDATICVGTFTYAHVGPRAFDELVRVTRPGGAHLFHHSRRRLSGLRLSQQDAGYGSVRQVGASGNEGRRLSRQRRGECQILYLQGHRRLVRNRTSMAV